MASAKLQDLGPLGVVLVNDALKPLIADPSDPHGHPQLVSILEPDEGVIPATSIFGDVIQKQLLRHTHTLPTLPLLSKGNIGEVVRNSRKYGESTDNPLNPHHFGMSGV